MDPNIISNTNFLIYVFIQLLLLLATFYAAFGSAMIVSKWDYQKTTQTQYNLEKRSYLVMVVIFFLSVVKIFLFVFFAFLVNDLSNIIPGAMCAAGVVEEFDYSQLLLTLKLLILVLCGVWLLLNSFDLRAKTYPYMQLKNKLFLALAVFVVIETIVELFYFSSLSTLTPVSCCSDIYGVNAAVGAIPLGLNTTTLLTLFYLTYLLTVVLSLQKNTFLLFLTNLFFLFIAYYGVVHFFGTYIYEQPTHKCPYCMLQKEYYYVGYFIWSSLFLGVFSAIASFVVQKVTASKSVKLSYLSLFFNTFFVGLSSYFVVSYYFINGVFL